ncbi:MAG: proton-conducting transporter membrane subunit [Planctomycetota bacterium]
MILVPGLVLMAGALLVPFLPRLGRQLLAPALGAFVLGIVASLAPGDHLEFSFWGVTLVLLEVDWLRLVFGTAFGLATFLWGIYAWSRPDRMERTAGLLYAGGAVSVVFAGDWLTFFLCWEVMALASTGVVLAGRTEASVRAAYRYFMVHILGGVILLAGIVLVHADRGSWAITPLALADPGAWLVFLGFAVNAAVWPLAAWLPDAYPAASPTGTVLLGTYTTKTAVFAFILVFAGETLLCLLGAAMAIYGIVYALTTVNYRRLLAYSLVGQVGFMLAAAGVGGTLGASAAAAHAFMHVLYKSLLFMSAGAVLLRTGRAEGGGFGGLWRRMPYTALFGVVGAAAISAVPLTNGYASKSLIFEALHASTAPWTQGAMTWLYVASAAAPLYVGLRYPWLAFSGRDEGLRPARAP